MTGKLDGYLQQLKSMSVGIRQQLEVAEMRVETANCVLDQLAATQLTNAQIFLGEVILRRAYRIGFDQGTGEVIQAGLALPGGFGAVVWDSEDFAMRYDTSYLDSEAVLVPFEQCAPAIKALLLPQLDPLMESLLSSLA